MCEFGDKIWCDAVVGNKRQKDKQPTAHKLFTDRISEPICNLLLIN